jgi:hypothetical protein
MKKVSEITFNLFEEIEKIQTLQVFSIFPAKILDSYYSVLFASRYLTNYAEITQMSDIANLIVGMFSNKWDTLTNRMIDLNADVGAYSTKTTHDKLTTSKDDNTRNTTNTVSPYDSTDFVNDNKTDEIYSDNGIVNEAYTTTVQNLSSDEINTTIDYLQKNLLSDIIFTDINQILTLHIY